MKNLATKNTNDFTILENGDASISQVKLSELTGIPRTTLQGWFTDSSAGYLLNDNNQLNHKNIKNIVKLGIAKGYKECEKVADMLMEAGSKGLVYSCAGYEIEELTLASKRFINNCEQDTRTLIKHIGTGKRFKYDFRKA